MPICLFVLPNTNVHTSKHHELQCAEKLLDWILISGPKKHFAYHYFK